MSVVVALRCPAKAPDGTRCRIYRGHDGEHGDGLGTVWDRDYSHRCAECEHPADDHGEDGCACGCGFTEAFLREAWRA